MVPVEVVVKYDRAGRITPLHLKYKEQDISIQDIGRRWEADDGKHLLVMDHQQQTYHLFQRQEDQIWFLIRDILPPMDSKKRM
jgi:hypothetical protein